MSLAGNRKFTAVQEKQFFKQWTCINPTISRFVNQDINLHFIFIGSAERKGAVVIHEGGETERMLPQEKCYLSHRL